MEKFKLSEYVVFAQIVCTIESIWDDGTYDIKRVYPNSGEHHDFDRVPASKLSNWNGMVTP